MTNSISRYILEEFGVEVTPGSSRIQCIFCPKNTMSVTRDDTLAKCFHSDCLRHIHIASIESPSVRGLNQVLTEIVKRFHAALINHKDSPPEAWRYLVEDRKIHPQVIADAVLGMVPEKFDVDKLFDGHITDLKERERLEADSRRKDQLTEDIESTEKLVVKFVQAVSNYQGWICFFFTDANFNLTQIHFRKPYTKDIRTLKIKKEPGIFGLALSNGFSEDTSEKLIVVEGEFDLLQLQSLALRVGEANE